MSRTPLTSFFSSTDSTSLVFIYFKIFPLSYISLIFHHSHQILPHFFFFRFLSASVALPFSFLLFFSTVFNILHLSLFFSFGFLLNFPLFLFSFVLSSSSFSISFTSPPCLLLRTENQVHREVLCTAMQFKGTCLQCK
ncbi:hypothetical protein ES332_D08G199000v1 [Gossypium tomentosum]|uniref:Uncharacterized protein n=1 Tax=Gossypium tomentosum TaxID=34277 RepID=A0A5D2JXB3_GOSTO|nr:hypothetical protein ES332_D08G199000v1 [Gossypium tomentosum]